MEQHDGGRGWEWVTPLLSLGFCVTVARGLDEIALADALRLDPEYRYVLSRSEAVEEFGFENPVTRVGRRGDWSFAVQECGAEIGDPSLLEELSSLGGAAATVWTTATALSWFGFAEAGGIAVRFDLIAPHQRTGRRAADFAEALREVGFDPGRPWPVDSMESPIFPALALLSRLTGLTLTTADVDGPLLSGELVE